MTIRYIRTDAGIRLKDIRDYVTEVLKEEVWEESELWKAKDERVRSFVGNALFYGSRTISWMGGLDAPHGGVNVTKDVQNWVKSREKNPLRHFDVSMNTLRKDARDFIEEVLNGKIYGRSVIKGEGTFPCDLRLVSSSPDFPSAWSGVAVSGVDSEDITEQFNAWVESRRVGEAKKMLRHFRVSEKTLRKDVRDFIDKVLHDKVSYGSEISHTNSSYFCQGKWLVSKQAGMSEGWSSFSGVLEPSSEGITEQFELWLSLGKPDVTLADLKNNPSLNGAKEMQIYNQTIKRVFKEGTSIQVKGSLVPAAIQTLAEATGYGLSLYTKSHIHEGHRIDGNINYVLSVHDVEEEEPEIWVGASSYPCVAQDLLCKTDFQYLLIQKLIQRGENHLIPEVAPSAAPVAPTALTKSVATEDNPEAALQVAKENLNNALKGL